MEVDREIALVQLSPGPALALLLKLKVKRKKKIKTSNDVRVFIAVKF